MGQVGTLVKVNPALKNNEHESFSSSFGTFYVFWAEVEINGQKLNGQVNSKDQDYPYPTGEQYDISVETKGKLNKFKISKIKEQQAPQQASKPVAQSSSSQPSVAPQRTYGKSAEEQKGIILCNAITNATHIVGLMPDEYKQPDNAGQNIWNVADFLFDESVKKLGL